MASIGFKSWLSTYIEKDCVLKSGLNNGSLLIKVTSLVFPDRAPDFVGLVEIPDIFKAFFKVVLDLKLKTIPRQVHSFVHALYALYQMAITHLEQQIKIGIFLSFEEKEKLRELKTLMENECIVIGKCSGESSNEVANEVTNSVFNNDRESKRKNENLPNPLSCLSPPPPPSSFLCSSGSSPSSGSNSSASASELQFQGRKEKQKEEIQKSKLIIDEKTIEELKKERKTIKLLSQYKTFIESELLKLKENHPRSVDSQGRNELDVLVDERNYWRKKMKLEQMKQKHMEKEFETRRLNFDNLCK